MSNYKYTDNNVQFNDINQISVITGQKISGSKYKVDENGNIIYNKPVINAIDIDWNNANVDGLSKPIKSTSDLINIIANNSKSIDKIVKKTSIYIGDNGNWWIDDEDTGIFASGENGLTPYIKDGAWYIGDTFICNINDNNGLTPYIKNGNWWIGDSDTGISAIGTAGNSPYIGEDGYWYINGESTGIPVGGNPGSDGQTPYIKDGHWWIGDSDTGVIASASNNSSLITIGENGNWFINGEDTGKPASIIYNGGDSNSIPIYDYETENRLRESNALPNKYISLDDEHNSSSNETLLSNLLSVVSSLQAEVNKLKNTFHKGIYSYNNEDTYMSSVVSQYADIEAEEPLWAIDEHELTEVEGINFDVETQSTFIDENTALLNVTDKRLFLYCTTDSADVNVTLYDIDDINNILTLNLHNYITCEKCNIMLIISRKPDDRTIPSNYIYLAINDYVTGAVLVKGYINELGTLSDSPVYLDNKYCIHKVDFNTNVTKFNIYSDDKELGSEVIASTPDEDEDSYRVAHIAIRSCKNYAQIVKVSKKLVKNELIFDENEGKLYIYSKGKIINIGVGTDSGGGTNPGWDDEDDNMTNQEILKALYQQGIISIEFKNNYADDDERQFAASNIIKYDLNNIGSINFVHEETGKTFEFKTNERGELESTEINNLATIERYLNGASLKDDYASVRGVIGQVGEKLYEKNNIGATLAVKTDHALYSDRIKIGALYAPLKSDIIHGCSHAYVELENSSDIDFNLTGCSLHLIRLNDNKTGYIDNELKLTGTIPAGSTYLIRGKQYVDQNDAHCFINVDSYDQEWYVNKSLIDLSIDNKKLGTHDPAYIFILMYDNIDSESNMYKLGNDSTINDDSTYDYLGTPSTDNVNNGKLVISKKFSEASANTGSTETNSSYVYAKGLIDAIAINSVRYGIPAKGLYTAKSNCIYKNTFELDPAKQAYNAMTKHDSSRQRWQNNATDYMYVDLNHSIIEFKKSSEVYPVNYFTPKASYEHKNVCTDKTKFDKEKPNAVTVSFGENMYTTRCFNWLSSSTDDEYVWIYDESNNLIGKFESYKVVNDSTKYDTYLTKINTADNYPLRKEFPQDINNIVYCDYRENSVIDKSRNKDVTYNEFTSYKRCAGLFAATNDFYVSHKCIVTLSLNAPTVKTKYYYVVGKADKKGNPDVNHTSEKRSFQTYPTTAKPVIYQITDQQGFHWIEYQVWAASAIKVNEKIEADLISNPNIMPIIINTGDATQSGSRINEWLDYFHAGDVLFNHFEQNNIVGNNDLNGTDIQFLGTGDDTGKSNGYYYYLFNCNEVNDFYEGHYPITNGVYMPSLYYIQTDKTRIVLINSEFTIINCRDWFNLNYNGAPVNIYTGYTNDANLEIYAANKTISDGATYDTFVPVYNLLYHAFEKTENGNRKCIAVCHEMPFTVITASSVKEESGSTKIINLFRSINTNGTSLVGSHMNQINSNDNGAGVYWFSRLMESQGVKLCIGGHKHTYTSTYPLRENYKYKINYNKSTGQYETNDIYWTSRYDGPMTMGPTLEFEERSSLDDNKVLWSWVPEHTGSGSEYVSEYQWAQISGDKHYGDDADQLINWSKLPITYRSNISIMPALGSFYPATIVENDAYIDKAVLYIMCQATGYKLTSNKELPTPAQKFSRLVPQTNPGDSSDTPDNNQKFPMFMIYDINESSNICVIKLARIADIFKNYKFTQFDESSSPMTLDWLIDKSYWNYETINKNDIVILSKYTGYDSSNDKTDENLSTYDNYGLWLKNIEHEMIPQISL